MKLGQMINMTVNHKYATWYSINNLKERKKEANYTFVLNETEEKTYYHSISLTFKTKESLFEFEEELGCF